MGHVKHLLKESIQGAVVSFVIVFAFCGAVDVDVANGHEILPITNLGFAVGSAGVYVALNWLLRRLGI